jgi:hypothetical protein
MSIRNRDPNATICVDVYDLCAQKNFANDDPYRTSSRAYTRTIEFENYKYDGTSIPAAPNQQQGKVTLNDPQTTPYDIPNFTKYWKPRSGTRLLLEPNSCKMLTFYGHKGWFDGRKYQDLVAIGGKTVEFLFICGAGPSPGMTNTTLMPQVTWTKEIIWRQEIGFGKPQNVPLTNKVQY